MHCRAHSFLAVDVAFEVSLFEAGVEYQQATLKGSIKLNAMAGLEGR
jgi:hypothetical protein